MIRNPYQKPSPVVRKRQQRPWEHQSPTGARRLRAAPPLPSGLDRNNAAAAVAAAADDPFDCGINWDDVVRVMDDTDAKMMAMAESSSSTKVPLTAASPNGMIPIDRRSVTLLSPVVINPLRRPPVRMAAATAAAANGSVSSARQQPTPRDSAAVTATVSNALASLRPVAWNQPVEAPTETTVVPQFQQQPQQSQPALPTQLRVDPSRIEPVQDSYRQLLVKEAQVSQPLLNGWTLYSHQKRAILRGLVMRRIILALDMGLGKTCIGCVWAKAFVRAMPPVRVIVICPVSLKQEWKRTAEEATGLSVCGDDGERQQHKADKDMWITSWAKVPTRLDDPHCRYVVIADEAHSMQSMQAARTRDTLALVQSPKCVGVLLLTGTPMKNGKPSNLFPLLRAVGHPLGAHQRAYEAHFCAGRDVAFGGEGLGGRRVWNATGSSNLTQLRELTQSHILYMTKEECLKDLPPQSRVIHEVPVSSRRQMEHDQALRELAKVYSHKDQIDNGNDAVLGAVQRLRLVGSFAKVEATVALAMNVLNRESAVVIFTSFVAVAKSIHQQLITGGFLCELLTGETPAKKRQDMVDNFQKGHSAVFVSTFGAGGVGLTLTAAHTVILLDRPWTPGETLQAEDRVRRIGQKEPVTSYWMSAFEIDKQIDNILQQKKQLADTVLDHNAAREKRPSGADAPKLSIFQLVNSIIPVGSLKQTSMLQFGSTPEDDV